MKKLINYILESEKDGKNGHYTDYTDEDTGEVLKIWIDDPSPEEMQQKLELAKKAEDEFNKKVKLEREILDKIISLEDEVSSKEEELKSVVRNLQSLRLDQEQEIGNLYADNKYKEGDELAQEYGVKMEELYDKKELLLKEINKLNSSITKLYDKYYKIW